MEQLKNTLLRFKKNSAVKMMPRDMRMMSQYIIDDAIRNYIDEFVTDEYLNTLLDDIKKKRQ